MDNPNNRTAVRSFAASFANAISETLQEILGSPWLLEVTDSREAPPRTGLPLQFRLKVDGGVSGECFIEFYESQVSELLAKLNGTSTVVGEDRGKALAAAIVSATERLKTTLAQEYGELKFKVDSIAGLAFGGMYVVPLSGPANRATASVLLYFDGQLLDALSSETPSEDDAEASKRPVHPSNLKLVMDVELNVSLRFGQRQLPLREVLELASGSVIELDRMVDEPVELLLDGKLVARGEAVVVDGNYGLRVTEIPQAVETHFLR